MRFPLLSLAISSCLFAVMPATHVARLARHYHDCPVQGIRFNPYEVPSFFAVRFLVSDSVFVPTGPLAEYTKYDYALRKQLRFGGIYLAEGNHNEGRVRYPHPISCKRREDTMVVYVRPHSGGSNTLYDSIPFRPGYYELQEKSLEDNATPLLLAPSRPQEKSFATDYFRLEGELQRNNPLAGCQFASYTPSPGRDQTAYVPTTPADIFRLLLVHKRYVSITHWKLRPLTSAERRALDKASWAH